MSIHYAVASALLRGTVDEESYRHLDDAALLALAGKVQVEADDGFTAAYPAKQGAEVSVELADGRILSRRLADVVPADLDLIHHRFRAAASAAIGTAAAEALETAVRNLMDCDDVGALMRQAAPSHSQAVAA